MKKQNIELCANFLVIKNEIRNSKSTINTLKTKLAINTDSLSTSNFETNNNSKKINTNKIHNQIQQIEQWKNELMMELEKLDKNIILCDNLKQQISFERENSTDLEKKEFDIFILQHTEKHSYNLDEIAYKIHCSYSNVRKIAPKINKEILSCFYELIKN